MLGLIQQYYDRSYKLTLSCYLQVMKLQHILVLHFLNVFYFFKFEVAQIQIVTILL